MMTDLAAPHYPTNGARSADLAVHLSGLALALLGSGILLGLAFGLGTLSQVAAVSVYSVGLILMLALSTVALATPVAQAAGSLRCPSELARKPARKQVAAKPRRAKLNQAWVNSDKTNAFFARRLLGVYQTVLRSPV